MEGLFEDHTRILKDAVANESTAYAMGQLTQLGIEFIPGVGLFGLSGIKKGGQVINLAFKNGKLNKKSVDALKNAKLTNNQIKAIEAKNAEAVVRKLRFDPETGKMNITDPNVANMSKTDNFDDVPSLDVGKKSSLSPALLANQEVKDMPTDMAAFWKKSQELEVYKDKKWTDLSAQQRANFKKKYDRFAEKNISVDDIVITRDKKRLIYPETYNTKSLYPYSPSHEPVAGGSRIRSSGVEFSHLENGKEIEKRFDEMVRNFYEYPMNSKNVPEEFNIESFNKFFFSISVAAPVCSSRQTMQ